MNDQSFDGSNTTSLARPNFQSDEQSEFQADERSMPELEPHHRRPKVLELTGYSTSTLYRKMAAGEFPKPKKMSDNIVAWADSDLRRWFKGRSKGQAA